MLFNVIDGDIKVAVIFDIITIFMKKSVQLSHRTEVSLSATVLHIQLHITILKCPLKMLQSLQMLQGLQCFQNVARVAVFSKCCKYAETIKMLQMLQNCQNFAELSKFCKC